MARPRSPLTDLVLTLPFDMPAKAVLARAHAKGIAGTSTAVWKVRQKMRRGSMRPTAKAAGGKAAAPTKPAPATNSRSPVASPSKTPSARSMTLSKADFVRGRPHLSPKEVLEDAKASGLKLDSQYVYNVRAHDKAKSARGARASAKAASAKTEARAVVPRAAPAVPRPIDSASSAEDLLRAVAAEIGYGRAIELLQEDRARVKALLRA